METRVWDDFDLASKPDISPIFARLTTCIVLRVSSRSQSLAVHSLSISIVSLILHHTPPLTPLLAMFNPASACIKTALRTAIRPARVAAAPVRGFRTSVAARSDTLNVVSDQAQKAQTSMLSGSCLILIQSFVRSYTMLHLFSTAIHPTTTPPFPSPSMPKTPNSSTESSPNILLNTRKRR